MTQTINDLSSVVEEAWNVSEQDELHPVRDVAVVPTSAVIVAPEQLSDKEYDARMAKVKMLRSYTGPVPVQADEFLNITVTLVGMIRNHVRDINEETGVVKEWDEIRIKIDDEHGIRHILSASGKAAKAFASEVFDAVGLPQGDFRRPEQLLIKRRQIGSSPDDKPKFMPTFQIL